MHVLDGGPTMNPSTYDLLAAIHAVPAEEVVVLPNSPNVVMAAERAAELSDRTVAVVASRSPQAGLAAVVSLEPDRRAAANAAAMDATLAAGAHRRRGPARPATTPRAASRPATRSASWRRSWSPGAPAETTLRDVLAQLAENAELITCLRGADAPLDDAAVHAMVDDGVELELSEGGQPSYWWLLSAE